MRDNGIRSSLRLGLVALALLAPAACSGSSGEPEDTKSSADTAGVPDECREWSEAPKASKPIKIETRSENNVWHKTDGEIQLSARWTNTTDLVAVDITVDFEVYMDGTNVTEKLDKEFLDEFHPLEIDQFVPYDKNDEDTEYIRGAEIPVPANPEWADAELTFTAKPDVSRWCEPK